MGKHNFAKVMECCSESRGGSLSGVMGCRRLGGESVAAPTGKSISVSVRACVRAVVGRAETKLKSKRSAFPFSLFGAAGFSLFPFRGGGLSLSFSAK